jgi:hypothetical protein
MYKCGVKYLNHKILIKKKLKFQIENEKKINN